MSGQMERIREVYGVPAKRGGKVLYLKDNGEMIPGIIVSATKGPQYLRILFRGQKHPVPCHPTWNLQYIVEEKPEYIYRVTGIRPDGTVKTRRFLSRNAADYAARTWAVDRTGPFSEKPLPALTDVTVTRSEPIGWED